MIMFKALLPEGFGDRNFAGGDSLTTPEAKHAFYLTLVMVAVAVPLNTVFGVACALVLVRHKFRGKGFLNGLIILHSRFRRSSSASRSHRLDQHRLPQLDLSWRAG